MVYYYVPTIRVFFKKALKNPIIIGCCIKVPLSPWTIYGQLFILEFFINEWKINALNDAIDFKLFIQETFVPLYVTTCSLGQFEEKINHINIPKSWNFEINNYKGND
jgi:hypothetical protein